MKIVKSNILIFSLIVVLYALSAPGALAYDYYPTPSPTSSSQPSVSESPTIPYWCNGEQEKSDEVLIEVSLHPDYYPGETSWNIVDNCDGDREILRWKSYRSGLDTSAFVRPSRYTFTIKDSWGDGICCSSGYGEYEVTYGNETVAEGGEFQYSESVTWGCCELSSEEPSLSPQPSTSSQPSLSSKPSDSPMSTSMSPSASSMMPSLSSKPSSSPSDEASSSPSVSPSLSSTPSMAPSDILSAKPSSTPSDTLSSVPSTATSEHPSNRPATKSPTKGPKSYKSGKGKGSKSYKSGKGKGSKSYKSGKGSKSYKAYKSPKGWKASKGWRAPKESKTTKSYKGKGQKSAKAYK